MSTKLKRNKKFGPRFRKSRALNFSFGHPKDALNGRNFPPGQHGKNLGYSKKTEFGVQLRNKQIIRITYGLKESALKKLYTRASNSKGNTIENLVKNCESRLASVIMHGFADSIAFAQQLVSHKHIKVNGKIVNKKGYSLKAGDTIELSEKSRNMARILDCVKRKNKLPQHIKLDSDSMKITYLRHPEIDELSHLAKVDLAKVIEYYNK